MFDTTKFDSKAYLETFYSKNPTKDAGEDATLHWFHRVYEDFSPSGKMLEFGGGPTIYSLISAAKFIDEIHFSDLLASNISEVIAWKNGYGHDWSLYIQRVLEFEGIPADNKSIQQRVNLLKSKLKFFYNFDHKVSRKILFKYDLVSVQFVPDSSTSSIDDFLLYTRNILSYLKRDGLLVMGVLKRSEKYAVGNEFCPAVYLTEDLMENYMKSLSINILRMVSITTYDTARGIDGYILLIGKKYY